MNSVKKIFPKRKKNIYHKMNDEYREYLWGLRAININKTWDWISEEQLKNVKIALIDTGVEAQHEDLVGNILEGRNLIDKSTNTRDEIGHGTQVAGVITAIKNNNLGVAGAASGSRIIPLKVIDKNKKIDIQNIINALEWAINEEVDIINISLGYNKDNLEILGNKFSVYMEEEHRLIKKARERGIVIVSSIGNEYGKPINYPAIYKEVIPVGSCGVMREPLCLYYDERNNSANERTVFAPGVFIMTTNLNNQYQYAHGTSIATGFVTSAVACIRSINKSLSPQEIHDLLLEKSVKLSVNKIKLRFIHFDDVIKKLL